MERTGSILYLLLAVLIYNCNGANHYCMKSRVVKVLDYVPSPYRCVTSRNTVKYTTCHDHGWWHDRCHHHTHYREVKTYGTCYVNSPRYVDRIIYYRECCDGWKGSLCNIPVCSGGCPKGGFCTAPGYCTCPAGREGLSCKIEECPGGSTTPWADCYPGTCASSSKCQCYDGFGGTDCREVLDAAHFKRCSVQLVSPRNDVLFSGKCGTTAMGEDYIYYTNAKHYAEIVFDAESVYQLPSIPRKPQYIREFNVGNVESKVKVTMTDDDGNNPKIRNFDCDDRPHDRNPYQAAECRNQSYRYSETSFSGYNLTISLTAKTGGYKVINNPDQGELTKYYTGQTEVAALTIIFDHDPPVHCHEIPNTNCSAKIPPLKAIEFTSQPNIEVDTFMGWADEMTGIASHELNVYKQSPNSAGLLDNSGAPVKTLIRNLLDEELDIMTFDLPKPGRYSLEMMTSDRAGNVRMSRALVFYDNGTNLTISEGTNVTIQNAVNISGIFWLTSFNDAGPTPMKVTWDDVFANEHHVTSGFLGGVERKDESWGYEDTFGNLTADPIVNVKGITSFQFAYDVDQDGGNSIHPDDLARKLSPVGSLVPEQSISPTIRDGYSIVVMVYATDAVGSAVNVTNIIHVDSTPPAVSDARFEKNVKSPYPETLPFTSALHVNARDDESGIDEVIYTLKLASGRRIGQKSAKNFTLHGKDSTSCAFENCYCTSFGACYPQPLPVPIDNCLFMNNLNDPITISYTVINGAGQPFNGPARTINPVGSVYGLHEYPSVKIFEGANITTETITLRWVYPVSCHTPTGVIIKDGKKEYHVDYPVTTYEVLGLDNDKEYNYQVIVKYPGNQSPERALAVTTGGCDDGTFVCPGGGLGGGGIAGIVIVALLLAVAVVLLTLGLLRRRSGKPPVPEYITNRFSRRFPDKASSDNVYSETSGQAINNYRKSMGAVMSVAYMPGLSGTEEDIYTYGELETDPEASWKHSGDKVEIGDVIASGRFADVKRATLLDKNGRTDMAAKMLRPGASADDILLMKAKMNFLATSVPPHENIVQLVGAVPNESPVILLELCNQTLKDWLKSQGKVDQTVEDNMINFTTHIARGLAHLHENHITHRRLGVRNILVKSVAGRFIAKITGFGPMKAETSGESNSDRERIPFKWMAPEQIGVKSGQKRIYNQQTDVWGFGITVWEIFTKGGSPYKENKLGEMEELHKSGYRLPKPENGPAEMYPDIIVPCWNKKPKSRPQMSEIVSKLNSLYHGGPGDDYVYEEDVKGASNYGFNNKSQDLYDNTV